MNNEMCRAGTGQARGQVLGLKKGEIESPVGAWALKQTRASITRLTEYK